MSSDIVITIVISGILLLSVVVYKFWARALITRWLNSKTLFVSRRMAKAVRQAENRRDKAKTSLTQVISYRKRSESELAIANQEFQQRTNNIQVAANQGRTDIVDRDTVRQKAAKTHIDECQGHLDQLRIIEEEMEKAFAIINNEYDTMVSQMRQLESRTAVATTKIEASQLLFTVGDNGSDDVAKAVDLVNQLELQARSTPFRV